MVKGISRQVILVHAPDPKLFEQAIFILREDVGEGVTEEVLLREARKAIQGDTRRRKSRLPLFGAACALAGALTTAIAWVCSVLL